MRGIYKAQKQGFSGRLHTLGERKRRIKNDIEKTYLIVTMLSHGNLGKMWEERDFHYQFHIFIFALKKLNNVSFFFFFFAFRKFEAFFFFKLMLFCITQIKLR